MKFNFHKFYHHQFHDYYDTGFHKLIFIDKLLVLRSSCTREHHYSSSTLFIKAAGYLILILYFLLFRQWVGSLSIWALVWFSCFSGLCSGEIMSRLNCLSIICRMPAWWTWFCYSSGHEAAILAALIPGINIIRMLLLGVGIWKDEAVVKSMCRHGDHRLQFWQNVSIQIPFASYDCLPVNPFPLLTEVSVLHEQPCLVSPWSWQGTELVVLISSYSVPHHSGVRAGKYAYM